jgi:hypothetical protein
MFARALYNIPKLSDEFVNLLRELRTSAPDEDFITQARVASNLTGTPVPAETKALERIVEYSLRPEYDTVALPERSNLLGWRNPYASNAITRITKRLGRDLTPEEMVRLGSTGGRYSSQYQEPSDYMRASRDYLDNAIYHNTYGNIDFGFDAVENARVARLEAQRRMALDYLRELTS